MKWTSHCIGIGTYLCMYECLCMLEEHSVPVWVQAVKMYEHELLLLNLSPTTTTDNVKRFHWYC
jgi:hypothetical protein